MYDTGKIIIGLIIFVGLITFPIYMNMGKAYEKPEPKVDTPAIQQWEKEYGKKECVESKAYMKTEHMKILNEWRDWVVRDKNRVYVSSSNGKKFDMSLQNTCMNCHSNKKKFCDSCHNFTAVKPYCWDCHIEPKEKEL
jgi:hypothetical protein